MKKIYLVETFYFYKLHGFHIQASHNCKDVEVFNNLEKAIKYVNYLIDKSKRYKLGNYEKTNFGYKDEVLSYKKTHTINYEDYEDFIIIWEKRI